MLYSLAADSLLVVHVLFIGFVMLGSFVLIINLLIYGWPGPHRICHRV